MRGSYGAVLSDVVWEQTVGRSACALDLKANEYPLQKPPLNTHGDLVLFVCNSSFHSKKKKKKVFFYLS